MTTTQVTLRLSDDEIAKLDQSRKSGPYVVRRAPAAYQLFCKGLGIEPREDEEEGKSEPPASAKRSTKATSKKESKKTA